MRSMPEGVVTFLFSDIEGSTRMLEEHPEVAARVLARHHELLATAVAAHEGVVFETVGDAVYAAFSRASDAITAAAGIQRALAAERWDTGGTVLCRIAVHAGEVERRGDHYVGAALFRCARLQALAYGGQVLLSEVVVGLLGPTLSADASLRDHGMHRLKDLAAPEHVFELILDGLPQEKRPVKSIDSHPQNLPVQLTTFVGREAELSAIGGLVAAHRLVTLTGPGGIGKTRVSLQVGAELVTRFRDGVFFVDLAPLGERDRVLPALAEALGLREQAGVPLTAVLTEHLVRRELMLVLDNFEQVLDAAPDVAGLLSAAPALRVLVTSRAPLRVQGEHVYAIPSMTVGATDSDAMTLFMERVRAARPGIDFGQPEALEAAMTICRRCDGIPLAIELAAARTRIFALGELARRLDDALSVLTGGARDAPARQATLRSAIAWSEGLLTEAQRRLFAVLSAFSGGFGVETLVAVTTDLNMPDPLEALDALVEHALVRRVDDGVEPARFEMYETIRQFAAERLVELGDADRVHAAHAHWMSSFLAAEVDRFVGGVGQGSLQPLRAERDNARAAISWSVAHDAEGAVELGWRIGRAFELTGDWAEGLRLVLSSLEAPSARQPDATLGALLAAGALSGLLCQYGLALNLTRRALDLAEQLGDVGQERRAAAQLSGITCEVGSYDEALRWAARGVELARAIGDEVRVASSLFRQAGTESQAGYLDDAAGHLQEALDFIPADQRLGRLIAAEQAFVESLRGNAAEGWRYLGRAKGPTGEYESAGDQEAQVLETTGRLLLLDGDDARANEVLQEALVKFDKIGDAWRTATVLELLGGISARRGQPKPAALLMGTAIAVREAIGAPVPLVDRDMVERLVEEVRSLIPDDADRLFARGKEGLPYLGRLARWVAEACEELQAA